MEDTIVHSSSGQEWIFLTAAIAILGYYIYYKLLGEDIWAKHGVARSKASWYQTIKMLFTEPIHHIDNAKYLELSEGRKMFGGYEAGKPILYVTDFELLKEVFIKDFNTFPCRRTLLLNEEGKAMAKSLVFVKGEEWKNLRSVMTTFFTTSKLRQMTTIMDECAKRMLDSLKDSSKIDVKKLYRGYGLDVNMTCCFSVKVNTDQTKDNPFAVHSNNFFDQDLSLGAFISVAFPSIAKMIGCSIFPSKTIKFFEEFTYEIIAERKKLGSKNNRVDFLQVMLDSLEEEQSGKVVKKQLDYATAVGQCIAVLLLGTDTNSSSLTFTTYFLALNPDCQERAYQEIKSVLAKTNNELTYENLGDFKYLDMCISEALRLLPPAGRTERMAVNDTTLDGVPIPKGTIVISPVYSIQNDKKYFPNPTQFDPERFSPENKGTRDACTYQPFGMGPRNCVGMRFAQISVKMAIIRLIAEYKMEVNQETPKELKFFRLNGPQGLKSKIILNIKKRNNS